MIAEKKRIEYWNFLTTEKNQARPKGITTQRLALIKPALIGLDEVWAKVIELSGAIDRAAPEFYGSKEDVAVQSRKDFWAAVGGFIRQSEIRFKQPEKKQNQIRRRFGVMVRKK